MKDINSPEKLLKRIEELQTDSDKLKQALQKAEDLVFKYKSFLENMEDRYFEVDLKGNYKYVNKAFSERMNVKYNILKDANYRDYVDQNLDEFFFEKFNRIFKTGIPERIRLEVDSPQNGQKIYIENLVSLMKNRDGKPTGFQCIGRDITELKQKEEALRKSEERYRNILENLEDGYYETDYKGYLTFVNQAMCRITGYSRDEMEGMHYKQYTSEESIKNTFEAYNQLWNGIKSIILVERELIRKDGTRAFTETSASIIRDESGNPVGFRGIARDITEKRKMKEALHRSKERYRTILESIEEGYYETDLKGNFTFVNQAMCEVLGYPGDELIGMNNRQYTDIKGGEKLYKVFNIVYSTGKPIRSFEFECYRKNGAQISVEISISLLRDEKSEIIGFRGLARDITARRLDEEELIKARDASEYANRAKSEFLANMSHEIRTPMNGIIGMTDLLLDTDLDQTQLDFTKTVRLSANALLKIINDILDFSKIEAGKLDLEKIDFDLRTTLEDVAGLVSLKAYEKGLEFGYTIDPELPSMLKGDPGRLRQVLLNLVGNAIKFTEKGEVLVRINREYETDQHVTIRFTVSDTGIGIPINQLTRLFQAFSQVDSTSSRKYEGTGLGLVISKQLCELMGGKIGVETEEGKGSTFWFTVNIEKQPFSRDITDKGNLSIRGKKILVIDDNQANRELLGNYLKSWGCYYQEASSGPEALYLLYQAFDAKSPFHLIMTDHMMPGMDGETLGKAIKADSNLNKVILVMLTSMGQRGDAVRMTDIGFSAYLTKPIRRSDLYDCLSTLLNDSKDKDPSLSKPKLITRHTIQEEKKHSLRILLAEDNETNKVLALRLMEKFGYWVDAVETGKEAIEALKKIHYDLVLMDIQMPEMDGLEATRRIRSQETGVLNSKIPIIALTAHAMKGDREICLSAGMDDYVSKPIDPDLLLQAIDRLIYSSPEEKIEKEIRSKRPDEPANIVIYDHEELLKRVGGDEDLSKELLEMFLEEFPHKLDEIKQALRDENAPMVARVAHTIKGSSANIGANTIREAALEMEIASKDLNLNLANTLVEKIQSEFEKLHTFLSETVTLP